MTATDDRDGHGVEPDTTQMPRVTDRQDGRYAHPIPPSAAGDGSAQWSRDRVADRAGPPDAVSSPSAGAAADRSSSSPSSSPSSSTVPAAPRRAALRLARVDPWSVMKITLLFSVCLFVVVLVATAVVWYVLDAAGVFDSVVSIADNFPSLNARSYVSFSRFMGTATFFGAVNVVLLTALTTVVTLVYNLCAALLGGIEVTLAEPGE